jgi:5-methylcytosine-specific restriction endonuclease McrA
MPTKTKEKLLPCPFCGGKAEACYQRDDLGDWKVECQGCGAVSCPEGMRYDRDLAVADWNKRITNQRAIKDLTTMAKRTPKAKTAESAEKKPRAQRTQRTRAGGEMTEAQFWSFLRSNLRLTSRKWAPISRHALNACKRPSQSDNKRLKFEHQCAQCLGWFPRKQVEVDHIVPAGSLRSFEDIPGFVQRLFCETDGLVVLCERCHQAKTYSSPEK